MTSSEIKSFNQEGNSSQSQSSLQRRSQRFVKKKHLSPGQTRHSNTLGDKIMKHKPKTTSESKETQSQYSNKDSKAYLTSYSPEVLKRLCLFSGINPESVSSELNNKNIKGCRRSHSFSSTLEKSLDFSICRSASLPTLCNLQYKEVAKSVTSDSQPCYVAKKCDNLYKSDSYENMAVGGRASQTSSASTVRDRNVSVDSSYSFISCSDVNEDRNVSVDSSYSFISCSDVNEIEDVFLKQKPVPISSDSSWRPQHFRSKSDFHYEPEALEVLEDSKVFSLPSSFSENDKPPRKSIFEGKQMVVPTECFFPRPRQGQTLTSFLSSNFSISAELDRENAHFCISEALISAIEHMKCTLTQKNVEREDESDEEIQRLSQRIRIRRIERQREKTMKSFVLLSDGKTDTTSQSASPPMSSHSSDFEADSIKSEDEVEDLELSAHTDSNLSSIKESGLSLSMASLYSDADFKKAAQLREVDKKSPESDSMNLSAESVALSLLKRFSEKHLPKASELRWLVSEEEVPQRLLPLPDSWPVSPDCVEEECNHTNIRLRGNLEWAPPRAQIISIIHPHFKRKEVMEKQKYRCAGCGMKIEKRYLKKFRYCHYFGKYFCQCCHNNGLAYVPGQILWKWDFTKYYVSKFAWDLLDNMYCDPLFNIEAINANLYQKVRSLDQCKKYRMQLYYLKDFIKTCRKAELIQATLESQSYHIVTDPHLYSLSDLVQVKSGEMLKQVKTLTNYCIEHVKKCILCQAKGFICEICGNERDIIFSYQLDKVVLCQACGCCFHKCCFKNVKCPRCIRIAVRKKRLNQEI